MRVGDCKHKMYKYTCTHARTRIHTFEQTVRRAPHACIHTVLGVVLCCVVLIPSTAAPATAVDNSSAVRTLPLAPVVATRVSHRHRNFRMSSHGLAPRRLMSRRCSDVLTAAAMHTDTHTDTNRHKHTDTHTHTHTLSLSLSAFARLYVANCAVRLPAVGS